ncbi:hypothetical protein EXIGLDRAFT_710983 [Exidia glandulosa HHB12029]|uniref:Endonuclease/exonuclease/phosphatase domain-containing protein n=1 Tax=Exidia glandulosa HHB12029 TaxID=1314781 RepID=A0A165NF54_EXIGL|nr:hypothetical protein EXIGLDRAFT_710983 [Exidia glandulosa HHB12029]
MPSHQLTPEALAKQAERKRKKAEALANPQAAPEPASLLKRDWIGPARAAVDDETRVLRFQTWNMLAQTLVRRELFPGSDCLKASAREPMTIAELTAHRADVLCLQEVDRLDKLLPPLHEAGYAHTYGAGPRKLHGCMILHRDALFDKIDERLVQYDQLSVGADEQPRIGIGRVTKNVALMVALRDRRDPSRGCVVATTHLFWHPAYTYERVRQVALLTREVRKFRQELKHDNWPCFVIGDFNFQPIDAGYALIRGATWTLQQELTIAKSRVVHVSVDPSIAQNVPAVTAANDDDEGEGGGGEQETDPDRIIVNCRLPLASDGLLTLDELRALAPPTPLRSVYDDFLREHRSTGGADRYRSSSLGEGMKEDDLGANEPRFTSYTHYWKAPLDYMFILDPEGDGSPTPTVQRVLRPLTAAEMEPGLPRRGVCASDHMSLAADIAL